MNWKKFKEEKPSEGEEVLAYHPSWIDEDFNPRGIRIGFWNGGDDFKSAHWWDYQDCYITISHCDCDDNSLFSDLQMPYTVYYGTRWSLLFLCVLDQTI